MKKFECVIVLEIIIWIFTTIAIMVALDITKDGTCLIAYIIPLLSLVIFSKEELYE
jgi:hypothetical protein